MTITFRLPDLGEGLAEAEIVDWHVREGDQVRQEEPLLSVETAKALVEVPSPYTGRVVTLHGKPGDVVEVGAPLVDFELPAGSQWAPPPTEVATHGRPQDAGTVVGSIVTGGGRFADVSHGSDHETAARSRALPAARVLARHLGVDLTGVKGSGRGGLVTIEDVEAAGGTSRPRGPSRALRLGERLAGAFEPLHGAQRAMAESMSESRDEVAVATVFDDADLSAWPRLSQVTPRVLRAMVAGVHAAPALNAVFDPSGPARRILEHVDIGLAVDVGDKLLVPVIRNASAKDLDELRAEVERLKAGARDRSLAPDELRDFTISLSNFGTVAGRYATPLVTPPTVAILGAGSIRRDVVAVGDSVAIHPRLPLSLSFDHRCVTGAEACRFLAAVIEDLSREE